MDLSVKHIWFDLDGTLYVQTPDLKKIIRDTIVRGVAEKTKRNIGDLAEEYEGRYRANKSNTAALTTYGLSQEEARSLYNSAPIMDYISEDVKLAGVIETVRGKGIQISIFTNNNRSNTHKVLEALGLDVDLFRHILTAQDVEPKPSQNGYLEIIARSDVPPQNLVYVGDRRGADIEPSQKVGMNTILVGADNIRVANDESRGTMHFEVPRVYDIIPAIDQLNDRLQ